MYQVSCLQSVADISGDPLLHLIWRSRCSITFSSYSSQSEPCSAHLSSTMRDGLSIIRCVWVRNDLSGETYIGSPANSCYSSCQVINHALASERTKASCLNACGRQYSPHCVGWNEEGGRGGAAERCEVGSHESGGGRPVHSLYVTRQKRNSKAHEIERKRFCWVGVIICMCLLWMKSLSELVTGCLNF